MTYRLIILERDKPGPEIRQFYTLEKAQKAYDEAHGPTRMRMATRAIFLYGPRELIREWMSRT